MTARRGSLLAIVLILGMGIGVGVGFWMPRDDAFELRKNIRIFGAVYENLVTGYAEPVDAGHLRRAGVEAMLGELDPYTTFMDEGENTEIRILTEGHYGGVGVNIGTRNGRITVIGPVSGTAAYQQGVRAGDIITEVDGQSAAALSLDDVERLLRGEPGTTVQVSVQRTGETTPREFTLTRQRVEPENVTYRGTVGSQNDVGYLKLERFGRGTGTEVADALEAMTDRGAARGIVLDLRGNPGGLLRAAVDVADLFLPQGALVVSTKGRVPRADNTYRSTAVPLVPDLPLVVLVDQYSASASEIVAGALQDHDRGVVLGGPTYGKGLVQTVQSLPYNTSLKMTTAQYYTPDGRRIQPLDVPDTSASRPAAAGRGGPEQMNPSSSGPRSQNGGLRPDVRVPDDDSSVVEQALRRRAAFFFYANQYAALHDSLPDDFAVTDALLDDFRAWLNEEDIRYPTDAERLIDDLQRRFEAEGYEAVRDEIVALREAARTEKNASFQQHADALKQTLEREIRARFADEAHVTEAMLPRDERVAAAVDVLRDEARYHQALASGSE